MTWTEIRKVTANGRARAFTLVELIVVIVIVAILATVAVVAYNSSINQFEENAASQAAAQVSKLYQADSAYTRDPVSEQYLYDGDLEALPFAQDLPEGVTGVEVWDDGTLYTYVGNRECQGPQFSLTTPGEAPVGTTDCSYEAAPVGPADPDPLSPPTYPSSTFTVGQGGQTLTPDATGGGPGKTFTYTGTLPTGVSFNNADGVITGPSVPTWPTGGPLVIGGGGNGSGGAYSDEASDGGTFFASQGSPTMRADGVDYNRSNWGA